MKLLEIISEAESNSAAEAINNPKLEKVIEMCGQFIGEVRNNDIRKHGFYRGDDDFGLITKHQVKTSRIPIDTPREVQELVDDWFEEKFNRRFRSSSVFATSKRDQARCYGRSLYLFVPTDGYEYCWSPVYHDFYTHLGALKYEHTKQEIEQFLINGKYQTTGLQAAHDSGKEIMFTNCNYFLIKESYIPLLASYPAGKKLFKPVGH